MGRVTTIEPTSAEEGVAPPAVEVEARILEERTVNHGFLFQKVASCLPSVAEGAESVELRPSRGSSPESYTVTASPSACRAYFSLPGASVELVRLIIAVFFSYATMDDAPLIGSTVAVAVNTAIRELHRTKSGTIERPRDRKREQTLVDACLAMLAEVRVHGRGPDGEQLTSRSLIPLEKLPAVCCRGNILRDVWCVDIAKLNCWQASTGLEGGYVNSYPLLRFDRPVTLPESSMHTIALDLIHELRGKVYGPRQQHDVTISRLWDGIEKRCSPPVRMGRGEFIDAFERVLFDCALQESEGGLHGTRRVFLDAWTEMGQGRGKGREYRKLKIRASKRSHEVRVELLGLWDGSPEGYGSAAKQRGP